MRMPEKGQGRIFVEKEEDIEKLKSIIKMIDPNEYESYLPDNLITVYEGKLEMVYTGKFYGIEMNQLMTMAWNVGIKCFWVRGDNDFE